MPTVTRWTRPDSYMGATHDHAYSAGFGESRESSALERSNFRVAWRELEPLDTDCPECKGTGDGPGHGFVGAGAGCTHCHGTGRTINKITESHWAVGWVAWISIHESNENALSKARELCTRADAYPPLDESDWSDLETEETLACWEGMSIKERVRLCSEHGESIFAARHNYPPDRVEDYLRNS